MTESTVGPRQPFDLDKALESIDSVQIESDINSVLQKQLNIEDLRVQSCIQTLDNCDKLITYIEDHLKDEHMQARNTKIFLLKICVILLRRLSYSPNNHLKGRVWIVLANCFPLFERSGLNPESDFNQLEAPQKSRHSVDNTESQANSPSNADDNLHDDIEEGETIDDDDDQPIYKPESSEQIYTRFWELQECFRKPYRCYDRQIWNNFMYHSNAFLSLFENQPCSESKWDVAVNNYLTDHRSLSLQISDANFRRCVLLQFAIMFQYLMCPSKSKKENHRLSSDQEAWVNTAQKRVFHNLKLTPPDGDKFLVHVENTLAREEFWIKWKADGCKEYKASNEEVGMRGTYAKRRKFGEELKQADHYKHYLVGSDELNRIWNLSPDNWAASRSERRIFAPPTEKFFERVIKTPVEERADVYKDPTFCFKALRLLGRRSDQFFPHASARSKPLDEYLASVTASFDTNTSTPSSTGSNTPTVGININNSTKANGSTIPDQQQQPPSAPSTPQQQLQQQQQIGTQS